MMVVTFLFAMMNRISTVLLVLPIQKKQPMTADNVEPAGG